MTPEETKKSEKLEAKRKAETEKLAAENKDLGALVKRLETIAKSDQAEHDKEAAAWQHVLEEEQKRAEALACALLPFSMIGELMGPDQPNSVVTAAGGVTLQKRAFDAAMRVFDEHGTQKGFSTSSSTATTTGSAT